MHRITINPAPSSPTIRLCPVSGRWLSKLSQPSSIYLGRLGRLPCELSTTFGPPHAHHSRPYHRLRVETLERHLEMLRMPNMTYQKLGTCLCRIRSGPPAFFMLLFSPARYETQGSRLFKGNSQSLMQRRSILEIDHRDRCIQPR